MLDKAEEKPLLFCLLETGIRRKEPQRCCLSSDVYRIKNVFLTSFCREVRSYVSLLNKRKRGPFLSLFHRRFSGHTNVVTTMSRPGDEAEPLAKEVRELPSIFNTRSISMIVVMQQQCHEEHIEHVLLFLKDHGLSGHPSRGAELTVIGVLGAVGPSGT